VASTKTAVVYACLYGGTRGPTERHHRCPCTTTAHSPAQPGDNSAAAAKNQTDAMLTCSSPATVLRRRRSASRPSSVCRAATTTINAAVRSAACGSAAGPRPAGGSSSPPSTSSTAQLSTASNAVISGAERLHSFHCRTPVRGALCDMRILIARS
jgi:hypothetical protein